MWLTNKLLREVLYKKNTLCCLCFSICGENTFNVYDEIAMGNCNTKSMQLSYMIDEVFGNKLSKVDFVSDSVCQECASSTMKAFKFITISFERNQELSFAMSNLTESVEEASDVVQENFVSHSYSKRVKQMYIATDSKSLQSVVFMDTSKRKLKDYSGFVTRCHSLITEENEHVAHFLPSFFHKVKCKACDEILFNIFDLKRHKLEHQPDNIKEESFDDTHFDDTHFDADEHDDKSLRLLFESTTARKIRCMFCNSTLQRTLLVRHMLNYCNALKEQYPDKYGTDEIINIIKAKHKETNQKNTKNNVESENIVASKEKKIVCQQCGVFCSASYLSRHMKKYCANKETMDNTEKELNMHFDEYICEHCNKSFDKKWAIRYHIAYTCKDNPHPQKKKRKVCTYCGKEVAPSGIKKHELRHLGHVYKCPKCGRGFKTVTAYNRHTGLKNCSDKYEPTPKNYICPLCGKGFIWENELTSHVGAAHYNSGYECEFCHKVYPQRCKLKLHMITHTKERNFQCTICEEKFVTKYSLLYHTRRHTGEKPHKCNFCDSRFLSASRRKIHERLRHLEPQLECKVCFKKFRIWNGLNRHKKKHADPKSSLYIGNKIKTNGSDSE